MDDTVIAGLSAQLRDKSLLRQECFINGGWIGAEDTIAVTDPATGVVIANVPRLGASHVRTAIESAQTAQRSWGAKTAKERSIILRKWFTLMMENQEDLAQIMTAEQGKPLAES